MRYEGNWSNGKRNGHGVLQSFLGGELEWRHEGTFSNDRIEGEGIMVCSDGRKI